MADRGAPEPPASDGQIGVLELIELWPTFARMGMLASLRAAGWATSSATAVARRLVVAARDGESPTALLAEAREEGVRAAREALGVSDIEATLGRLTSDPLTEPDERAEHRKSLRERGEELLARSARLEPQDDTHPAFGVVLEELAPDEVRILRLLATQGAQAAIDVEAAGPLGVGTRPFARRLSLVGELAGCLHVARVQIYLDNLTRLGLVQLNDEPLDREESYEVLEAQPHVATAKEEAAGSASKAKVVRRRIELSSFGRSFCETCLPLTEETPRRRRRPPARRGPAAPAATRKRTRPS